MKQPLLFVALAYAAGISAARFLSLPLFPSLWAALASVSLALLLTRLRCYLLYLTLFLAGAVDLQLHTTALSPRDLRNLLGDEPRIATIQGRLCETPVLRVIERGEEEKWRTLARIETFSIRTNKGCWQPALGRVAVTAPGALTNLFAGQIVEITGVIEPPPIAVAEGTFDYRAFLQELEVYYQLKTQGEADWHILSSPARPPLCDRFRSWGKRALALGLPTEDEALRLEWALTLGWKTALTEDVSEPYIRASTYHIFAVDGLRMGIVFSIVFTLLRCLRLSRPISAFFSLPCIWFYVVLTGSPASAIRASVMLSVILIGWMANRPWNPLNSLFAAALLILLCEPRQLFQAGFQLSFFVVLILILMLPPLHSRVEAFLAPDPLLPQELVPRWRQWMRRPAKFLTDVTLTSFAAWIGSLPLAAYYFNIFTPVSTPANLLAVPLCALVLISNLLSLLLAAWLPAAAELFNHSGWALMQCIRFSSRWFAGLPCAYWYVRAPGLLTVALFYGLLLAVITGWLFRTRHRVWRIAAAGLPVLFWLGGLCHEQAVTRLTVLPLNGGFGIYDDSPGWRSSLLIDCGPTNSVLFTTKPFLRAQGVNTLPRLALTHGDIHHMGGVQLLAQLFTIRQICISPVRFRSPIYRRSMDAFKTRPGLLQTVSRGDSIAQWTVLHPEPDDRYPRADDNALVLYACIDGLRILLLSDLGRPGQEALLNRMPRLRADIVVTGLPSVGEPVCDGLLDQLQPRILIVADSEFPATERASPELRARLASRNIPLLYTRETGAVTLDLWSGGWELRSMSGIKTNACATP